MSSTLYTIKISNAIACAMQLDDPGMRREFSFEDASFKRLKSGYKFTGTLTDLERLAYHMTRDVGWDMSPATIYACNKRAKEIRQFIAQQKVSVES